ncbi:MAG TPA: amidohydrolase family protein [Chloroflexia bacterium]|nr:amidohydrolase family protein [Chloroflexia bacterium]
MKLLNVRLIDNGNIHERVDIEIEEGRIKGVSRSGEHASTDSVNPEVAGSLDLAGMTVIPGLINMHIHILMDAGNNPVVSGQQPLPYLTLQAAKRAQAMLEAGITTARDLGGQDYAEMSLRRAINEGWLPGPHLLVSGKVLTMTGGHGYFIGIEVDGEDEARKAARYNLKMGADCIKMMATGGVLTPGVDPRSTQLSEAELRAGFEEAIKAGKLTATHAGGTEGIKNAVRAGVRTVEHGIFLDDEAIAMMIERGTYLSATLSAPKMIVAFGEAAGVPKYMVDKSREVMESHLKSFANAYKAGVKIGCGSDAGTPFNPHADLVTELQMMREGGMSTLEVLKAATAVSAEALKLESQIGTLEAGKFADLVVVDGDPLADLETLRQPLMVYKEGKLVFRLPGAMGDNAPQTHRTAPPVAEHSHPDIHLC